MASSILRTIFLVTLPVFIFSGLFAGLLEFWIFGDRGVITIVDHWPTLLMIILPPLTVWNFYKKDLKLVLISLAVSIVLFLLFHAQLIVDYLF